jgi:hypothetical protein
MFDGQSQLGAFSPHIEIRVTPAVELAGAAQRVAWSAGMRVFAGVMNQEDGQLELALEFARVREQSGDLAGFIFLHPMQSDQWIQNQQPLRSPHRRWLLRNGLAHPHAGWACRARFLAFLLRQCR